MTDRRGFLDTIEPPAVPPVQAALVPERGWVAAPPGAMGPVRHVPPAELPAAVPPAGPVQPLLLAGAALVFLVTALAGLELANFTAAQFARADWLGWLTLALLTLGLAALGWASLRELSGFTALATVDSLRRDLASDDPERVRASARRWLATIGASPQAIQAAPDAPTIRALLHAGPLARLDEATAQAGRAAALQVLAAIAVSPWPGLDGAIMVWRGLRLVGQVARLHGMRPGTIGTLRLFRRVALDAGTVAATDIAVAALTEALFATPLASALAGQAAGSLVAARRMIRLAVAVAQTCRPL